MALRSTVYKAELQVSDMDRGYYALHPLTLALHPSETEERMMVRLLAFALHADPALIFGKGLSSDEEPDLWRKDLTGAIAQWIEVGLPDERRIRQAAGRAEQVVVLAYGGRAVDVWWQKSRAPLQKLAGLTVWRIEPEASETLAAMARRTMQIQASIQDGEVWITDGERDLHLRPLRLD